MNRGLMGEVINLYEINLARRVVKDVPVILELIKEIEFKLQKYIEYSDVKSISSAISESKIMLNAHLAEYSKKLERK